MKHPSFLKELFPARIGLINLGCARNLVDAQQILGQLKSQGHRIVDMRKAEVAIVNTCGFIEEAKEETIETILDLIDLKNQGKLKKIIVLGCFAQRYPKQIAQEFKEVDFIGGILPFEQKKVFDSVKLTPQSFAYVKICEGCYNHCSFCAIPRIKGRFTSRYQESILTEVAALERKHVREINIIGQDISAYGLDIYKTKALSDLLNQIVRCTKRIRWIRLLYLFPAHVDDALLDTIAHNDKICCYFDLPLQHNSDRILKSMNRKFLSEKNTALIDQIRKKIPHACLRSSFIVGYPGETDKEFVHLCDFIKKMRFDKVGVFMYSQEEGTPAARMARQVSEAVKQERYAALMEIQQRISRENLKKFVNTKVMVLIDKKEKSEKNLYVGRREHDAPEVDGVVFVRSSKALRCGDFVRAKVTDSYEYDLVARYEEMINESAK